MTIKDAILSYPGLSDIPDNYISKVLIDRSVTGDGAADYALAQKETVALCAADCYVAIVNSPDFNEGRLSIKMSRGFILKEAERLYNDNGEPESADKLKKGKGNAKAEWW